MCLPYNSSQLTTAGKSIRTAPEQLPTDIPCTHSMACIGQHQPSAFLSRQHVSFVTMSQSTAAYDAAALLRTDQSFMLRSGVSVTEETNVVSLCLPEITQGGWHMFCWQHVCVAMCAWQHVCVAMCEWQHVCVAMCDCPVIATTRCAISKNALLLTVIILYCHRSLFAANTVTIPLLSESILLSLLVRCDFATIVQLVP